MSDKTDWRRVARFFAGECSPEEREKVNSLLKSDPEKRELMSFLERVWETRETFDVSDQDLKKLWKDTACKAGISQDPHEVKQIDSSRLFQTVHSFPKEVPRFSTRIWKYAAIFMLVVSIPYFVWRITQHTSPGISESAMIRIEVNRGDRQSIDLPDGTKVVLDSGTIFSYPEKFSPDIRRVEVEGEAYIEAASDPDRPFEVSAGHAKIRVLGTRFNVSAWPDLGRVEVAVAEGRVSLSAVQAGSEGEVVIQAGEMSILLQKGTATPPQSIDITNLLSWMNRETGFDNTPLSEILMHLERWYDIRFILVDKSAADERLTIHIQDRPLEDILELLAALTDMEISVRGKMVLIKPKI